MKKIGAILLVAGTCIGSGMIALPMVLAKLGMIPGVLLMLVIWFVMYYTSLVNLELNLQANQGLVLGELGRRFSGKGAKVIGTLSLKLLSYSLLAVFIYGGSSIIQQLIESKSGVEYSFDLVATGFTLFSFLILLLPIKLIDYVNRLLFVNLLGIVIILIVGLAVSINWNNLPLISDQYREISTWTVLIPVVFTSFGFQVIFHTLTNYCGRNAKILKQAFFWGSLIPAIVYILWTCSILSVVYHENPEFYQQMVRGKVEVGELIEELSLISKWQSVQLLVWVISLLAILTSVIGVGIGLSDYFKTIFLKVIPDKMLTSTVIAAAVTLLPAYLTVLYIPNAFIAVLGFAGMILAVIAVILPTYLFWKIKNVDLHYKELKCNLLVEFCFLIAIAVIACELYNML